MTQTISITPNWQVYIPLKVRKELGLEKSGKAKIKVQGSKIIITPIQSEVLKLAGKYKNKNKKGVEVENIRDKIDYTKI